MLQLIYLLWHVCYCIVVYSALVTVLQLVQDACSWSYCCVSADRQLLAPLNNHLVMGNTCKIITQNDSFHNDNVCTLLHLVTKSLLGCRGHLFIAVLTSENHVTNYFCKAKQHRVHLQLNGVTASLVLQVVQLFSLMSTVTVLQGQLTQQYLVSSKLPAFLQSLQNVLALHSYEQTKYNGGCCGCFTASVIKCRHSSSGLDICIRIHVTGLSKQLRVFLNIALLRISHIVILQMSTSSPQVYVI